LDHRMVTQDDDTIVQLNIKWDKLLADSATWEDYIVLRCRFPGVAIILFRNGETPISASKWWKMTFISLLDVRRYIVESLTIHKSHNMATWKSSTKMIQRLVIHKYASLLCDRQLHRLNNSRATVSKLLHQESIASRSSPCWRYDHIWIQWVAIGITCKNDCLFSLLMV
jgi:hypothetical protein